MLEEATVGSPRFTTYRSALSALGGAQKPGDGVPAYTRWVNRRLARYAAAAAYRLGWTPNVVTAVSALFSLAAIVLLLVLPAQPLVGIAIGVLFAIGYLLDSADGQVARLQGTGSPAGEWLDHVVDAARTPAVHLAVLVAFYFSGAPRWALVIVLLYCLVSVVQFMSQILAEKLGSREGPSESGVLRSFILLPTDNGTFCWMFILWGFPPVFLVVYTAMFALTVFHSAVSMRRKYLVLRSRGSAAADSRAG
jgi:phosphatidylglycerophosphate synthase